MEQFTRDFSNNSVGYHLAIILSLGYLVVSFVAGQNQGRTDSHTEGDRQQQSLVKVTTIISLYTNKSFGLYSTDGTHCLCCNIK